MLCVPVRSQADAHLLRERAVFAVEAEVSLGDVPAASGHSHLLFGVGIAFSRFFPGYRRGEYLRFARACGSPDRVDAVRVSGMRLDRPG